MDTTAAIESYAMDCPSTDIILLGYSQVRTSSSSAVQFNKSILILPRGRKSYSMSCAELVKLGLMKQPRYHGVQGRKASINSFIRDLPISYQQLVKHIVRAVVLMGDTSHIANAAFDVGTSTKDGVS